MGLAGEGRKRVGNQNGLRTGGEGAGTRKVGIGK